MLNIKKQLAACVLLLLVALPLCFSVCMFAKQQLIRYQQKQQLKTALMETISIEATKVDWVEAGEEINIDGKLFDIASFTHTGSAITFTGFYDYKETKLIKYINEVEHKKNKNENPISQSAVTFLLLANFKECTSFLIQTNWQTIIQHFGTYSERIASRAYPAVYPPPKFC